MVLNREALVLRNRMMTEAFHRLPIKHHVRGLILQAAARIPIPIRRSGKSNERILIMRPDHLGDMLLTTPAIHALRVAKPNAEIHLLVGPWSADVIANYPEVDYVLTFPFPGFSRTPKVGLRSPYQQAIQTARFLRRIGYSSAVIMRPDHWWGAMVAKFAGIPHRIGYNVTEVAPFLTQVLNHHHEHAVIQSLGLVEPWTGKISPDNAVYTFPVNSQQEAYVDGYLEEWGIDAKQPIFCIHPGTGTWVKHWQEDKWRTVADILSGQLSARVVFTGGDHELPLIKRIVEGMEESACIMAGDTRIGQLAALYRRASVVLGPDSGPLHLAAAVGTPTVSLFGPADPTEFRPWGRPDKHIVITSEIGCRPCRVLDWGTDNPEFHPCVREISVGRVLEATHRAINHGN